MSRLSILTSLLGIVCAVFAGYGVWRPSRACAWLVAFPRSRGPGWTLAAADFFWASWLTWQMPMGRLDSLKPMLFVLAPALILLAIKFMDDLLSARAFGGLLLLVPCPLLDAARWHESPLRLIVVVLAYVMVIIGMILVLSPHRLRWFLTPWTRDEHHCSRASVVGLLAGVIILLLGLIVY